MMRATRLPATGGGHDGRTVVYAALVAQSMMASGTHVVARAVAQDVEPFTLTLLRSLIAACVMGVPIFAGIMRPSIRREDYLAVAGLSFLAIPVNQFLFLMGMRYTLASNAALLYSTTPIFVLLFSRWFLHERLSLRKIAGVILGLVGVTVVIFEHGLSSSLSYLFGDVIVFLAVLAWALYTVFGKPLIHRYGAIQATATTLLVGTAMFIPIGLIPALSFPFHNLTSGNWLEILYLALITSVSSYFLWYYALGRIEAGKAALFTNLQPVLTSVLAVVFLGQAITVGFVIGGAIALAGVVLAQFG